MTMRLSAIRAAVLAVAALSLGGAVMAKTPSPTAARFVGTTPCDPPARQFIGIEAKVPCERITWRLALTTGRPARYALTAAYGLQAQSAPGLVDGGTTVRLQGAWSTVQGIDAGPTAMAYRLTGETGRSVAFAKIGETLLHLLNDDKSLAVGNSSWSYTLNSALPGRGAPPSTPNASARRKAAGIYEGRTPCEALAREFGIAVESDCTKLKWRLTLAQDPSSGTPTTFRLDGTPYRRHPLTGRWAILKDGPGKRTVYRLTVDQTAHVLSFLKADDNILLFLDATGGTRVGDDAFSYTLNRSSETS